MVVAVIVFTLIKCVIYQCPSVPIHLQAFISYQNLGNSKWFVSATFEMYLITIVVFFPFKNHLLSGSVACFLVTLCCTISMKHVVFERHYCNTLLLFPSGLVYLAERGCIETMMFQNDTIYCTILLGGYSFYVKIIQLRATSLLYWEHWESKNEL